jgi:NADH dehydrogenase FAD-containing subunit
MLHEVAAAISTPHIVTPIRRMVRRAVLFVGTAEEIDLPGRRVLVRHTGGGHAHELEYDHLVLRSAALHSSASRWRNARSR